MALYSNTADGNSAFGDSALYTNSTGASNAAFGYGSLAHNTSGSYNSAFGATTLLSNTIGNFNVAIGTDALRSNTSGHDNVAIGVTALLDNVSGINNIAIGSGALAVNNTGQDNVAIGGQSLLGNTSGRRNSTVGFSSLASNSSGFENTAVGWDALIFSNGNNNSAFGFGAVAGNTTGNSNTGIGTSALGNNISGNSNTALGASANTSTSNLNNSTAIGNNAVTNSSNKIRLGNASISVIEGQVAYSFPSDARFKTNVKSEDVKGLEFIKKLRPVVYNFDTKKFTEFLTKNMPDSIKKLYLAEDFKSSTAVRQSGFIAQEVEQAAKDAGYDFNGLHKPHNYNDNYSLAYSQFVVPLVKAVQEQQSMIDDLKQQVATLSQQNAVGNVKSPNTKPAADNTTSGIKAAAGPDGFSMEQNIPNPFTHETIINYTLPQQISSAYLAVYDLSGKQVGSFPINQKGTASLSISADKLAPGIYLYSIIGDGTVLDTKRMVVTQ